MIFHKDELFKIVSIIICTKLMLEGYPIDEIVVVGDILGFVILQ